MEEEIFFLVFLILYTLTYFQLVEEALSILEILLRSAQVLRLKWDNVNLWQALNCKQSSVNSDSIFSIDKSKSKIFLKNDHKNAVRRFYMLLKCPWFQTQTKHLSPGRPMVNLSSTREVTQGKFSLLYFEGRAHHRLEFFFRSIEGVFSIGEGSPFFVYGFLYIINNDLL